MGLNRNVGNAPTYEGQPYVHGSPALDVITFVPFGQDPVAAQAAHGTTLVSKCLPQLL